MNETEKAGRFAELQVKGSPLVLFNAWDAGSAKSIVAAGAQAIATSSWSRRRRVTEMARPSQLSSLSRSSRGSQRPSMSLSVWTSTAGIAKTTESWPLTSRVFSNWASSASTAHRANLRGRHAARQRHGHGRRAIE
jgi:hypothetical protein